MEIFGAIGCFIAGFIAGGVVMTLVYKNNPGVIAKAITELEVEAAKLRDKLNAAVTLVGKK